MFTAYTLIWIAFAPLGYIIYRWFDRTMDNRWTRSDRMFAILFSLFYGPLTLVIFLIGVLIHKIVSSDWGSKEARW